MTYGLARLVPPTKAVRLFAIAGCLVLLVVSGAFAQTTTILPDYSTPVLVPASQASTAWTSVIPNALASYFTYVPYSHADAIALGFPSSCGNPAKGTPADLASTEDCYTITVRKFAQQLALPSIFGGGAGLLNASGTPFGAVTKVYGYGSGGINWTPPGASASVTGNAPAPFVDGTFGTVGVWHFPAPTFRATKGRPVRVQWLNELPNEAPVGFDPTLPCGPNAPDCYPYNRIVTHVHGAHVKDDSDGFAEAWFTPGFAVKGPGWRASTYGPEGTFRYPMDQEAATIWYHDHAMGTTHENTQMGMAGFFLVSDANEQTLIASNILPTGNFELGFALQDRVFDINGQFGMPDYPIYDWNSPGCTLTVDGLPNPATCRRLDWMKAADGHLIPYVAGSPLLANANNAGAPFPAASTTLEYFGNMPVVNGVAYGKYDVQPRVYRMRFIGGSDSRTWVMKLVRRDTSAVIPFWQVGSEQGLLNNPVRRNTLDLMPGERLDVLVDLTGVPAGTRIVMQNLGPDFPYEGPAMLLDPLYTPSADIPEIMEFRVVALVGTDTIERPDESINLRPLTGPVVALVPTATTPVRNVSLIEITDYLGRVMPTIDSRRFMAMGVPATEIVRLNDTEVWNIVNTTADAHPMHLHLVQFQVIGRQTFTGFVPPVTDTMNGVFKQAQYTATGPVVPPSAWEAGWKDTIDSPPGMVTMIRARFDIAGQNYVYHCHILSHEENDMMRPLVVATPSVITWATPPAIRFGLALSATQLNATANVAGTLTYTPDAGTLLNPGVGQTLSVTFTPADPLSYTTETTTVQLTVLPFVGPASGGPGTGSLNGPQTVLTYNGVTYPIASGRVTFPDCRVYITAANGALIPVGTAAGCTPSGGGSGTLTVPLITWVTPASVTAGTPLSATQLNASTTVAGTWAYSPAAGMVMSAVGPQMLSVVFTPTNAALYTTATKSVVLTVTAGTAFVGPGSGGPATGTLNADQTVLTYNGAAYLVVNGRVTFPDCRVYIVAANGFLVSAGVAPNCTPSGTGGTTPVVTWANPASVSVGTPLSGTQLNATTTVPGTWVYSPPSGTVMNTAGSQTLSVTFTPSDTTLYTTATKSVTLVVTAGAVFLGPRTGGPASGTVNASETLLTYNGVTYPMINGKVTFPDCTVYIAFRSGTLVPAGTASGCSPGDARAVRR